MDQNETANQGAEKPGFDRRNLLTKAGLGALGAALLGNMGPVGERLIGTAHAQAATVTDQDILNFALNLEYLEGEYYTRGVSGGGLPSSLVSGTGYGGGVNGGHGVPFQTSLYLQYAQKIAVDEQAHINFLRQTLGSAAVGEPLIDLAGAFQTAAMQSGAIPAGTFFDPFANEVNFFLGALALTQVGVSAYAGAANLIQDANILSASAGILAAEAYHLGAIRTVLGQASLSGNFPAVPFQSQAIATFESQLSDIAAPGNPITESGAFYPNTNVVNIAPADANAIGFRRAVTQVLNVVYGGNAVTTGKGGFFPNGLNGRLR